MAFILGMIIGGSFGFVMVALVTVSKEADKR